MANVTLRNVTTHAAPSPWPEPENLNPWEQFLANIGAQWEEWFPPAAEPPATEEPAAATTESVPPPAAVATPAPPAPPTPAPTTAVDEEPPAPTGSAPPPSSPPPISMPSAPPPSAPAGQLNLPPPPAPLAKSLSHQLAGCENYLGWREEMVKLVNQGKKPPASLLTLLEASLYKLSDEDLRDEYRWYAEAYMSDESSDAMRTACEMIVIRIGEIVNVPQGARVDKRKHNKRLLDAQVTPRQGTVTFDPNVKGGGED